MRVARVLGLVLSACIDGACKTPGPVDGGTIPDSGPPDVNAPDAPGGG